MSVEGPVTRTSRQTGSTQEPLVSCLCVTESRPAFMPWLLWCFDRQSWLNRELVIVDSSTEPFRVSGRDDVRVIAAPPGAGVARKRNLAIAQARGEIITWFDDDDWQHPDKLMWIVEALGDRAMYAGSRHGWWVILANSLRASKSDEGWRQQTRPINRPIYAANQKFSPGSGAHLYV